MDVFAASVALIGAVYLWGAWACVRAVTPVVRNGNMLWLTALILIVLWPLVAMVAPPES